MAFAQDIIYKKVGKPISVALRYAVFDTKGYDSRVYIYENDVLNSYSVPALNYKGQRIYIMLNIDITRNIEIWLRVAQNIFDNQTVLQEGSLKGTLNFYDDLTHIKIYTIQDIIKTLEAENNVISSGIVRSFFNLFLTPYKIIKSKLTRGYIRAYVLWDLYGFANYVLFRKKQLFH